MKILIAYDGSECSDVAIEDLQRAGLPAVAEVLVLSVADTPPQMAEVPLGAVAAGAGMFLQARSESESYSGHPNAHKLGEQAADRLRSDFPKWHVTTESWVDAAASAIIRTFHAWQPDLTVLGSRGCTGISRLLLGSVSQYVLHHVTGSVRISRHRLHSQERSIRLLIGVDGSNSANIAVRAVAARNWPIGTEARVIGVLDSGIALAAAGTLEGTVPVDIEEESQRRLSEALHEAARELEKCCLLVTHQVLGGNPGEALLAEAETWAADCVFVGARGLNGMERFLLGSVSTTVASHAHCSVEIVR